MTIYTDSDQSTHDAAPIEAYKFIGSFNTYKYTSNDTQITVAGEVYEPLTGLLRRSAKTGTQAESKLSLIVDMPYDTDIIQDYAFDQSPPRLTLEVRRVHRQDNPASDYILFWKGRVTSFSVKGRTASLQIPSLFATVLAGDVPNHFYQRPCNHVLFDSRCKVLRSSHNSNPLVVSVGDENIEVDDDGFDDGVLAAGEFTVNRTGEKRLILDNQANLISISYPFVDIVVGETVELTKGCDHAFTTCNTKFSNATNHGGFPFIPGDNPFVGTF